MKLASYEPLSIVAVSRFTKAQDKKRDTMKRTPKGKPVPDDVQRAVKRLIAEDGEDGAAERLELSTQTLARLAGGLSVNASTLGLVRFRLGLGTP